MAIVHHIKFSQNSHIYDRHYSRILSLYTKFCLNSKFEFWSQNYRYCLSLLHMQNFVKISSYMMKYSDITKFRPPSSILNSKIFTFDCVDCQ